MTAENSNLKLMPPSLEPWQREPGHRPFLAIDDEVVRLKRLLILEEIHHEGLRRDRSPLWIESCDDSAKSLQLVCQASGGVFLESAKEGEMCRVRPIPNLLLLGLREGNER